MEQAMAIRLNSYKKAKDFVETANSFSGEFEISQDHHYADGKSMMGVLSLDLSRDLYLEIKPNDGEEQKILQEMKRFLAGI